MSLNRIGKKGREWIRARRNIIKGLVATGKYEVEGTLLIGHCKDCKCWGILDLDHKEGRGGLDPHRMENLDPVCRKCHNIRHMNKSKSKKKANWEFEHKCSCGTVSSLLLCPNCGKISIKQPKEK